jgi:hypothetical protein
MPSSSAGFFGRTFATKRANHRILSLWLRISVMASRTLSSHIESSIIRHRAMAVSMNVGILFHRVLEVLEAGWAEKDEQQKTYRL